MTRPPLPDEPPRAAGPDDGDLRIDRQQPTLRELALERLRGAIIAGRLRPGERLVERMLGERLGVSRSIVREVLRHLESEGLVRSEGSGGPMVARVGWPEARQIYAIRSMLESAAAAACAEAASEADLAALEDLMAQIEAAFAAQSREAVLGSTQAFYGRLFAIAGHDVAWELVTRLNGRISRLRAMTIASPGRSASGPSEIRLVLEAIRRKDGPAAAAASAAHVARAAGIAERMLTVEGGG